MNHAPAAGTCTSRLSSSRTLRNCGPSKSLAISPGTRVGRGVLGWQGGGIGPGLDGLRLHQGQAPRLRQLGRGRVQGASVVGEEPGKCPDAQEQEGLRGGRRRPGPPGPAQPLAALLGRLLSTAEDAPRGIFGLQDGGGDVVRRIADGNSTERRADQGLGGRLAFVRLQGDG